ncbi:MAG: SDR family oxidoreductase [Rhizobiaceae bacterium]|nr:SDR family oxidoreductase [Rhizobiaceae bacterium]
MSAATPPVRKCILITGATDGIGLALANRLAPRHHLLLTGRRGTHPALPQGTHYVSADQADPTGAARAVTNALEQTGWAALDLAVLNAGTGFEASDGLDAADRIRQTLDVNLSATIALAHGLFPCLAAANGTLTLVGSVAHKGAARFPAYAASKAALHGLARALRSEWRGRVTVQVIHPGPVATAMHAKAGHDPGRLSRLFIAPDAMAAMMERAAATGGSPVTLSFAARALHAILPEKRL